VAVTKKDNLLKQAVERAKSHRRLMIIEMPEEYDTTPHWLTWIVLGSLIGLVVALIWQMTNAGANIQAYLPFL
jgi:hypothetical protein